MPRKPVLIENPILNSPFREPDRHFEFDDIGITSTVREGRRRSTYFVPVPRPKKRDQQLTLDAAYAADREEENTTINRIRERVTLWRAGGYHGVTQTTQRLLEYWTNPDRDNKLFFCQIEALETVIYITEAAQKYGDGWMITHLREANESSNPLLFRIAMKMATGSGKTVVMAMLIAWQTLNKLANRQDTRFSDTFLIVTPGITIRDRLRVLLPNDPQNYYRQRDVVPGHQMEELQKANILITNFHAFLPRETVKASKLAKQIAGMEQTGASKESPAEMVRRVCRSLGNKKNIVVINDEAHHCYRRKPDGEELKLTGDERKDAQKREEEARIWISGLEAVKEKLGIRLVYDLSATPFFLKGSGYKEGVLFPWVVSDFSLIDAIESGVVKVPRVPVADDAMSGDLPTYRELWLRIREDLPKKGRKTEAVTGEPKLPVELQGALHSLYSNYEQYYRDWESGGGRMRESTPPVFIVVCNNTNVSKLVYDYIAGWEDTVNGRMVVKSGQLPVFRNDNGRGNWLDRPNTILIDSEQLESGESMSPEFKKAAAVEIDEFKREYRQRFPDRDVEALSDEDLLREVMNTVGKAGRLGEHVKCVVSVSMLTEGWDANTVTHVLGVRAFGTQLLCEQVVGRALRRRSYEPNDQGRFEPEYAEVYGVPFSFIPCAGSSATPPPRKEVFRVRALEDRRACEIAFPRLMGYRYDLPKDRLRATFDDESTIILGGPDVPTWVENAPIVGEHSELTLEDLKKKRIQEVVFEIAKTTLEKYFRTDASIGNGEDGSSPPLKGGRGDVGESSLSPASPVVAASAASNTTRDINSSSPPLKGGRGDLGESSLSPASPVVAASTASNTTRDIPNVALFPQLVAITRRWLAECVKLKDNAFPQLLILAEYKHNAADRIYRAIVREQVGEKRIKPILRPYDTLGSTRYVDFDTTRAVYVTDPEKCHVNYVVADTESWEQKMAQTLESMDEVIAYVKNHNLGFTIPYTVDGNERAYTPDFIVRLDDGHGPDDPLNLIIEVSGAQRRDKDAKVATAKTLWVPAVNNHGGFGRWEFTEIKDPWDAAGGLRQTLGSSV